MPRLISAAFDFDCQSVIHGRQGIFAGREAPTPAGGSGPCTPSPRRRKRPGASCSQRSATAWTDPGTRPSPSARRSAPRCSGNNSLNNGSLGATSPRSRTCGHPRGPCASSGERCSPEMTRSANNSRSPGNAVGSDRRTASCRAPRASAKIAPSASGRTSSHQARRLEQIRNGIRRRTSPRISRAAAGLTLPTRNLTADRGAIPNLGSSERT